jgi:hypothetical protein
MATTTALSTSDVARARVELDKMRRSLAGWLKYRTLNDAVVSGAAPTTKPRAYAVEVISTGRDWSAEQRLAKQLYVLLSEVMPGVQLPNPDVSVNPSAAVQLARIALEGPTPSSPASQGAIAWWWPAIIAGALLMTVTTIVKTSADTAREKERLACIQAGACTDYGFWLKAGGVAALVYVAWNMGLAERVKRMLKA